MKNFINIIKLIIAILTALLIVWVLYLKSTAAVVKEIEASTEVIHEPYINETETIIVEPTVETNTETTSELITIAGVQIINDQEWVDVKPVLSYNTSVKSNLTEQQIEFLLKDSPLEGSGWAFKQVEDCYGVSALFAVSVANIETTLGKYGCATSCNNCFGLTKVSGGYIDFNNKEDSILYFGSYIERMYHNKSIYQVRSIGNIYCDDLWGDQVIETMNNFYEKIN